MTTTKDIRYIGVNDHQIDLFEGQYIVPNGMSYNSYVILDEKIAVMDTVDAHFTSAWLENLKAVLAGRTPDYLVVQHMEPDHSGSIAAFMETYPQAVVVASAMALNMMNSFYGTDYAGRNQPQRDGDTLSLGQHTLTFISAPMVHWPEVLMTYDAKDKTLFSADAFGKFGALDTDEPWLTEARRYYIGIVGKFGMQVTSLLKKAAVLDIARICPLHGPVLEGNIPQYISLYQTWASYAPEKDGICLAYCSVYGHTAEAAQLLAKALQRKGRSVELWDLNRCDKFAALASAFACGKLVLAATTYCGSLFPAAKEFILMLTERNFQNRTVALMENYSWAPAAANAMEKLLVSCKNLTMAQTRVQIHSALSQESLVQIGDLARELA